MIIKIQEINHLLSNFLNVAYVLLFYHCAVKPIIYFINIGYYF